MTNSNANLKDGFSGGAESDPSLRELEALLDRAAAIDARASRDLPGSSRGRTIEDRIFASTNEVLNAELPVIATIGPERRPAAAWRIAAAIAVVGCAGILYTLTRPVAGVTPNTAVANLTTRTSSDVEYVLAAVSLLDEPLGAGMEDLMADAAKLNEMVSSDRNLESEQSTEEKPGKQGV